MNTAISAIRRIAEALPLKVHKAEWQDPVLLLRGDNWKIAVTTPWRLVSREKMLLGSDDVEPDALANLLSGNVITECRQQSNVIALDPIFMFDDGHILEIFSVSALEPWVMSFGDFEIFAASPTE